MSEREALLQAILDAPEDDRRLVFADWQEEHGRADHAELIRVQCELARLEDTDSVRAEVLRTRQKELLALPGLIDVLRDEHHYERGFITNFYVVDDGVRSGNEAAVGEGLRVPLDRVLTLSYSFDGGACPGEGYMRQLATRPWLNRITSLEFLDCGLLPAAARALAGSPHLRRVETLTFHDSAIPADGLADLVLGLANERLQTLELEGWFTEGEGGHFIHTADHPAVNAAVRQIVTSPCAASLKTLNVSAIGIGPDGGSAILESPYLGSLQRLHLEAAHRVPRPVRDALRAKFARDVNFTGADGYDVD